MKIAALAPQFVIAAPEGDEAADAKRVQRRLQVAKVEGKQKTEGSGEELPDGSTHDETRSGLKRLAQFISRQRRAPEHDLPKPSPNELIEKRAPLDSHHYLQLWMEWSKRPRVINSMAEVIASEMNRRRGLAAYKKMQGLQKKESFLPAVINF